MSDAKMRAIDDALHAKMSELARRDRQRWVTLSRDQRIQEAVGEAMADVQAEAARKEFNGTLQVLRTAETDVRVRDAMGLNDLTRSQGLIRDIENTDNYVHAVHNEAIAGLGDLMDAASNKDGTGVLRNLGMRIFSLDNPAMTADVVREVFGNAAGRTGNAAAKAGAKAWLEVIEGLRQRFNAAGGNVGKLGYGYLSQVHDAVRIAEVPAAEWARKVLPLMDREQYVKPDGRLMTDAELLPVLQAAHETLATGGSNKTEPGQFRGAGARANRGSDSRVLHFKDGDAWMAYMKEFGQGSLYDAMIGHIGKMTRDIGLVERYGPNPEQQFRLQNDIAERADGVGTIANRGALNRPQAYWDLVTSKATTPENRLIGQIGQDLRNVQVAAKLGGAVLTSMTDVGTVLTSLHYNRLPYFDMLGNIGKQFSAENRDFLQAHGIIGEAMSQSLNRWTGENMTHSLTGRVAASVMRLSLLNAWTDGLRNAFAMTMMKSFTSKLGKDWGALSEWDRYLMERKGLTEQDWAVITQAKSTDFNGNSYLTGDAVRATGADSAQQAANKWMAFVSDESQFAVLNPDMATRAIVTGGGIPAGTVSGEAARAFYQFKSFPTSMLTRHWRRIFETPQGLEGAPAGFGADTGTGAMVNRIAGVAALNVTLTMLGALVLQTKGVQQGKDPYDMTTPKFWMRAVAQGGGFGYLGDLVFKDPTEQRGNSVEQGVGSVAGPVAGAAAGLVGDLGFVNAWEAAKGKDTHFGAEALRWGNSQLPYQSLWWTRPAWEHWVLFNAQEALNPGYLNRVKQRAMKDWGQAYWWEPSEPLPDRAPDFSNVGGR